MNEQKRGEVMKGYKEDFLHIILTKKSSLFNIYADNQFLKSPFTRYWQINAMQLTAAEAARISL